MDEAAVAGPSKNPRGRHVKSGQRLMAYNVYLKHKNNHSKTAAVHQAANEVGISKNTLFNIIRDMESTGNVHSPPKKRICQTKYDKLDEAQKSAIRRHVHSFFLRNELPTCTKIFEAIRADDSLPIIKRTSLWRILKKLGFKWEKRTRNNILIERDDIVLWRRRYLSNMRKFRAEGRKIYYLDETWVNAGHTKSKIWKDTTVISRRQAFVEGLSTGLKDPSGKGKRLIVLHIGSETGFVEGGLLLFESKKTGDYHEEMNSTVFTEWIQNILPLLEPGCVIVMDNAPYHSTKTEKSPTLSWKKNALIEWLLTKGISVEDNLLKVQLLELVKQYTGSHPVQYVVDEIVRESGRTILRLPPYHCNLNPIELVWAQVKHHVAANNTTFKLDEVRNLLLEGINLVDSDAWKNNVQHAIKEEDKMYDVDNIVDEVVDNLSFNVNTGSSSEFSFDSDSDLDFE